MTVTDGSTGQTVRQFAIKADPYDICVSTRKDDGIKAEVSGMQKVPCWPQLVLLMLLSLNTRHVPVRQ